MIKAEWTNKDTLDLQTTATDCISRQAAIDALEREKSLVERPITETRWFDLGLGKAQDVLSELPSAQSEQKTGEWIKESTYYDATRCKCSLCGESLTTYKDERTNYCPNCGAKMR